MSVTRTVVPGDWYGVLGESVIVLLPPAAKSRVAALWETVDDGAGFDEVLDALISGGLRELPGFVLVSGEGRDVKVVIRGAGSAELKTQEGPVTVSGSADTTWVEQNIGGVDGLLVRVADPGGTPYTVSTGSLNWPMASVDAALAKLGSRRSSGFTNPRSPPSEPEGSSDSALATSSNFSPPMMRARNASIFFFASAVDPVEVSKPIKIVFKCATSGRSGRRCLFSS